MSLLLPTSPEFLHLQGRARRAGWARVRGPADRVRQSWRPRSTALATWLGRRGLGAGHARRRHGGERAGDGRRDVRGLGPRRRRRADRASARRPRRRRASSRTRARAALALRREPRRRRARGRGGRRAFPPTSSTPTCRSRRASCAAGTAPTAAGAACTAARGRSPCIAYTSGTTGAPEGRHADPREPPLGDARLRRTPAATAPDGVGACLSPLTHTPVLVSHLLCRVLVGATRGAGREVRRAARCSRRSSASASPTCR